MEKLKPCPLCNGKAVLYSTFMQDGDRWRQCYYQIACSICHTSTERWAKKEEVVRLWNNSSNGRSSWNG